MAHSALGVYTVFALLWNPCERWLGSELPLTPLPIQGSVAHPMLLFTQHTKSHTCLCCSMSSLPVRDTPERAEGGRLGEKRQ